MPPEYWRLPFDAEEPELLSLCEVTAFDHGGGEVLLLMRLASTSDEICLICDGAASPAFDFVGLGNMHSIDRWAQAEHGSSLLHLRRPAEQAVHARDPFPPGGSSGLSWIFS